MMCKRALSRALGIFVVLLTVGSAKAESLCLGVVTDDAQARYLPIAAGDKLTLRFSHSVYGSTVEEEFKLASTGFESVRLRYSEPRLVEFYGHHSLTQENGFWIVDHATVHTPFLDLHVSSGGTMQVFVRDRALLRSPSTADIRARLFVSLCPVAKDG